MSIAERYTGPHYFGCFRGDGYFTGACRGGPYDGALMSWNEPTYGIVMCCSTADHPPEVMRKFWEDVRRYQDTRYEFIDSTWVWRGK